MRITNKIMQNNSLININNNKIYSDKLNQQLSTQKKITRPSDDPVVAIRALRLRSNLAELSQYFEKNIPDAKSWLEVTEDALLSIADVITDMYKKCQKGSNSQLESADRLSLLEDLKALRDEVYATGNADYAGRSVFTGYRTNMKLSFQTDTKQDFSITEQLGSGSIDKFTYVSTGNKDHDLSDINSGNYDTIAGNLNETDITSKEMYRLRLAYDKLDHPAGAPPELNIVDENGNKTAITLTTRSIDALGKDRVYNVADDEAVYVPETGEILLGKDIKEQLEATKDEIQVTYDKSSWEKGDLRPEHYFACTDKTDPAKLVEYNPGFLDGTKGKQEIEYDVSFNQSLRVNTTADEAYTHAIGRDVDELIAATQQVVDMEATIAKLTAMQDDETLNQDDVSSLLKTAKKSCELLKDKSQKMFENGMTKMQGHLDKINLAVTNSGTRSSRLDLVNNRMMTQQTTFKELTSNNEDADMSEVAIRLASAELSYEAALAATGKVVKTSLLNFI